MKILREYKTEISIKENEREREKKRKYRNYNKASENGNKRK